MRITDKTLQSYIKKVTSEYNSILEKDKYPKYKEFNSGTNLIFRIHSKTGNASWLYRIAMPNPQSKSGYKFTRETIGSYPTITYANALHIAEGYKNKVKAGINPVEEKRLILKNAVNLSS